MSTQYSKATKEKIVSLYNQGYGCNTISKRLEISSSQVKRLINRYLLNGKSGLEHLPRIKTTADFKMNVVQTLIKNELSLPQTALRFGISISAVRNWLLKFNTGGYELLSQDNRGRKPKIMGRPRMKEPQTELEKLQYENELLRTELALLKKVKALVEERETRLRKIGQEPSKN